MSKLVEAETLTDGQRRGSWLAEADRLLRCRFVASRRGDGSTYFFEAATLWLRLSLPATRYVRGSQGCKHPYAAGYESTAAIGGLGDGLGGFLFQLEEGKPISVDTEHDRARGVRIWVFAGADE